MAAQLASVWQLQILDFLFGYALRVLPPPRLHPKPTLTFLILQRLVPLGEID